MVKRPNGAARRRADMERLTEKRDTPLVMSMWPGDSRSLRIYNRLSAYEDTGLEPEEIAKIREDVENGYLKSTARRYGISVDRLRELAQADREGRCMILPVKLGTPVWSSSMTEIREDGKEHPLKVPFFADMMEDWGRRWHLTEGEATAAMKGEQDG